MANVRVITYKPEIHQELQKFMISQYPNRSADFIKWWLTNIKNAGEYIWNKTLIILDDDEIIGCMTANKGDIYDGELKEIFYEANTIIHPSYRNRGIGKLLYNRLVEHSNRCTIGLTKIAYQIQTKFLTTTILNPIFVYGMFNIYTFWRGVQRIIGKKSSLEEYIFHDRFHIKGCTFMKINSFEELVEVPDSGLWLHDRIEIPRSLDFLKHRFDRIWRASDYQRYIMKIKNDIIGYVVYRKGRLYDMDIMVIVDYRCANLKYEKLIFNLASKLIKINKVGFCLCLTSRKYNMMSLNPLRIRLPKLIQGVAGPAINGGDIFFTSADSDLDFVYYQ